MEKEVFETAVKELAEKMASYGYLEHGCFSINFNIGIKKIPINSLQYIKGLLLAIDKENDYCHNDIVINIQKFFDVSIETSTYIYRIFPDNGNICKEIKGQVSCLDLAREFDQEITKDIENQEVEEEE